MRGESSIRIRAAFRSFKRRPKVLYFRCTSGGSAVVAHVLGYLCRMEAARWKSCFRRIMFIPETASIIGIASPANIWSPIIPGLSVAVASRPSLRLVHYSESGLFSL